MICNRNLGQYTFTSHDLPAEMVVMPENTGDLLICVTPKPLTKKVLREVHPLPEVDDTPAQLTCTKDIKKLDGTSGFWQIPLAKTSNNFSNSIWMVLFQQPTFHLESQIAEVNESNTDRSR